MANEGDPNYDPFLDLNDDESINMLDVFELFPLWLGTCPLYLEYNGDGVRTSQTVGKFVTDYDWDIAAGLPVMLQETKREILYVDDPPDPPHTEPGDVVLENSYVYGLDLISATDGAGVQTYHLYDGLGSTTDLTDGSGNVTASYGYDVFGEVRTGTPPYYDDAFLFTGEQRDWETGLYYLRARYYDPEIGRFLAQDPLRGSQLHPQTQNRYPYVGNNPTNWLDPTGLRILYRGEFYRGAGKEGSNFVAASNRNPNCNGTLEFTTGLQGALG